MAFTVLIWCLKLEDHLYFLKLSFAIKIFNNLSIELKTFFFIVE